MPKFKVWRVFIEHTHTPAQAKRSTFRSPASSSTFLMILELKKWVWNLAQPLEDHLLSFLVATSITARQQFFSFDSTRCSNRDDVFVAVPCTVHMSVCDMTWTWTLHSTHTAQTQTHYAHDQTCSNRKVRYCLCQSQNSLSCDWSCGRHWTGMFVFGSLI